MCLMFNARKFLMLIVAALALSIPAAATAQAAPHHHKHHAHKSGKKHHKKHGKKHKSFSFSIASYDEGDQDYASDEQFFSDYDNCVFAEMEAQAVADQDNDDPANEDNEDWVDPTLGPDDLWWATGIDACGPDPDDE